MHMHTRNVNTAFRELVTYFDDPAGEKWPHRSNNRDLPICQRTYSNPNGSGTTLAFIEPVTITYSHPRERVLFNAVRDANPFLHLYEAFWMLAGRNDVAPLAYYSKRFETFSDDGRTLNGAYGYRWRRAERHDSNMILQDDVDQLDIIVNHLKVDPNSRRVVLSMWNVEDDLMKIGKAVFTRDETTGEKEFKPCRIEGASKDVCCNLDVMFALRPVTKETVPTGNPKWDVGFEPVEYTTKALDMTVTNRSNDLLWGMLGANYVHFTILQEYIAARLGAEVGRYHHFTNNLHVYDTRPDWRPEELLKDRQLDWYGKGTIRESGRPMDEVFPLVSSPENFEHEVKTFVANNIGGERKYLLRYAEPFLDEVAQPMMDAFYCYKNDSPLSEVLTHIYRIAADDWRLAARNWMERRPKYAKSSPARSVQG